MLEEWGIKINFINLLAFDAGNDDIDAANALIKNKKININGKDENGYTALHHAVASDSLNMVKLLLEKGADPMIKTDDDLLAIDVAFSKEAIALLEQAMAEKKENPLKQKLITLKKNLEQLKQHLSGLAGKLRALQQSLRGSHTHSL